MQELRTTPQATTLLKCIQEAKSFIDLAEQVPIEKVTLKSGKEIDYIDEEAFRETSELAGMLILTLADLRQGR